MTEPFSLRCQGALPMEVEDGTPTSAEILSQLKASTESALEANKAHQYALTKHAERLMAEMEQLDNLMNAVATDDVEDELDAEVQIHGAVKATGPCSVAEFLKPDSPFYEEASRRSQYLSDTIDHPMKAKELDALAEAVRHENLRLAAYASQRSGQSDVEFDVENNTEGINWTIVAENVNRASGSTNRTADQCRIRWLGDRHPSINHGSWSQTELEKLKNLVSAQTQANEGKVNWVQVANELGTNRTPIDCMRHGVQRQRHVWNPEADSRLAEAVKLYGTYNWNIVARYVSEDATASQCQVRYTRVIDPSRKRGVWTDEEFTRLKEAVEAYGSSWVEVAACVPGRTNEQCRERWTEHLNCASAGAVWTEEHDSALVRAVGEIGNRWKEISVKVGNGTTGQQCRTRWEKLKRLQDQQQAAAAASVAGPSTVVQQPSVPKAKGRVRKGGTEAQDQEEASTPRPRPKPKGKGKAKVVEPDGNEAPMASTPSARPKPRPIGKGKGKAEPTPAIDLAQDSADQEEHGEAGAGEKRALDAIDEVEEPARKRRKTNKSRDTLRSPSKKVGRPRKSAVASPIVADASAEIKTPVGPRLRTRTKSTPVESPAENATHPPDDTRPQRELRYHLRTIKVGSPRSEHHSSDDGEVKESRVRTPRGRGRGRGRGKVTVMKESVVQAPETQ